MISSGVYVAGFTDPALKAKENVYDLYVDSMFYLFFKIIICFFLFYKMIFYKMLIY